MTPQFKDCRVFVEHCSARYRTALLGNPFNMTVPNPDDGELHGEID